MVWLDFLKSGVFAVLLVLAAILAGAFFNRQINRLHAAGRLPEIMFLPLKFSVRYGLLLITFLLVLGAFQVDIGNFWNFVSALVGLVAIGFVAVWSLLSNLSSAFLLLIFKPFGIGDRVELVGDAIAGKVTDMNLMFTVIKDADGRTCNIPNNIFFQKPSRKFTGAPPAPHPAAPGATALDHSQANLAGTHLDQNRGR